MVFLNQLKHIMPTRDARIATIIHAAATEGATVGLLTAQVPGDRFVIGAVQIEMIIQIASEYGVNLSESAAVAVFNSQIATLIGLEVVNQGGKYIPLVGNALNGFTAFSVTETIGWATNDYYKTK